MHNTYVVVLETNLDGHTVQVLIICSEKETSDEDLKAQAIQWFIDDGWRMADPQYITCVVKRDTGAPVQYVATSIG